VESGRKLQTSGISIAEATSWDPQPSPQASAGVAADEEAAVESSTADLYGIRLKMEEKRKRIEADKRHMELMASKQREKVGKAAFLQVD